MNIIYEDKFLLVCSKPAGLATQTSKVSEQDLVSILKNRNKNTYLGLIHRLDQPVEGLLVFAKTKETASSLSKQLTEGKIHKHYYAAIAGKPITENGTLIDFMDKDSKNGKGIITSSKTKSLTAKKAILHYRLKETIINPIEMSLIDVRIETGRFHQIRAQMSHHNMPLLGDIKYGNSISEEIGKELGIKNVALCAYSLEFIHPQNGENLQFKIQPTGKVFSWFEDT